MAYHLHPSEQVRHDVDRARFLSLLRRHLPESALLSEPEELRPYECDGLTMIREPPWLVALPETLEQVRAVLEPVVNFC